MNSGEDGSWSTVLKNRKSVPANCSWDSLWENSSSHLISITVKFPGVPAPNPPSLLPCSLANWRLLPNVFRCHSNLGGWPVPEFGDKHDSSKPPKGHARTAHESPHSLSSIWFGRFFFFDFCPYLIFIWCHIPKEDLKYLFLP